MPKKRKIASEEEEQCGLRVLELIREWSGKDGRKSVKNCFQLLWKRSFYRHCFCCCWCWYRFSRGEIARAEQNTHHTGKTSSACERERRTVIVIAVCSRTARLWLGRGHHTWAAVDVGRNRHHYLCIHNPVVSSPRPVPPRCGTPS